MLSKTKFSGIMAILVMAIAIVGIVGVSYMNEGENTDDSITVETYTDSPDGEKGVPNYFIFPYGDEGLNRSKVVRWNFTYVISSQNGESTISGSDNTFDNFPVAQIEVLTNEDVHAFREERFEVYFEFENGSYIDFCYRRNMGRRYVHLEVDGSEITMDLTDEQYDYNFDGISRTLVSFTYRTMD